MPIQPMGFRKLETDDVNPFNTAFQTGLQNYVNTIKAQYLPQQSQADILSKAAYATYTPYGYISKALSDPLVMASLAKDPENLRKITGMLGNIPTDPMQSLTNGFGNQNSGSNSGNSLWGWAKGLMSGDQGAQGGDAPLSSADALKLVESRPDHQNIPNMNPGDSWVVGSGQPPQQTPMDNSQVGVPSDNLINAAIASKLPLSDQGVQMKANSEAKIAGARTTSEIQSKELNLLNKEAYADSSNAFNLLNNANKFKEAYDAATIKGTWANLPGAEKVAQFDPEARDAMNAASNMAVDMASKLFGNRQSDYREKLAQTLKFSITMPEKTVKDVMAGVQAEGRRLQEHTDFVQKAQELGMTDPNKIRNAWFDYNRDRPFYNPKDRKVNEENINSYPQYLVNKIQGGSVQSTVPPQYGNVPNVEHNNKKYIHVNGRWQTA